MKYTPIILLFCLYSITTVHAQRFSLKYGKVTKDELQMKVYDRDTSAAAIVIYDNAFSVYKYKKDRSLSVNTLYKKKIKILSPLRKVLS